MQYVHHIEYRYLLNNQRDHTDRNHSIKSHIMTLTNPEKRMLIYVLDLFDGEAEAHKAPPPPLSVTVPYRYNHQHL
jgi:hypothetical protein